MNQQLFVDTLKKNRLSVTQERRRLFSILDDQHKPLSMHQLVYTARSELDRSTVYRTIDLFEKIGIITRVYTGWKFRVELSELFSSHHHHMTCVNCGQVISFEESDAFDKYLHSIASRHNFSLSSHSLELKGLCQSCS